MKTKILISILCFSVFLFSFSNKEEISQTSNKNSNIIKSLVQTTDYLKLQVNSPMKLAEYTANNLQTDMQSFIQNSENDIVFIENLGQIKDTKGNAIPDILFLTRSQGVDMYITNKGISYVFRRVEGDIKDHDKIKDVKTTYYRLDMEFVGINKNIRIKKELAVEQQFNYYTPEYPNGISPKAYKKITIENVYDGIALIYYEKEGKMKYDFIVKAGANPDKIKMKYIGAGTLYMHKDGSIIVTTPMGEIREEKPYTYLKKTSKEIASSYKIESNIVQFDIAENNKREEIIIDPYRIWATYYGGSLDEGGKNLCVDNSGNLYIIGATNSTDFPLQTLGGAYNQSFPGGSGYDNDLFILKFNSSGARLWATYYGGSSYESAHDICTDNSGAIYITGRTGSTNFPIQAFGGAYYQTTLRGSRDAFILKFNSSGARLWATYYGGSEKDYGYGICIDNSGVLYITGSTNSTDFPTQILTGAYNQTTYGGNYDAFISKFNSSGVRLWATYYGGSSIDFGYGICNNNSSDFYLTGYTFSTNFPTQTLPGAYNQTTHGGGMYDTFILKFNSSGARIWATYFGGNGRDEGNSICTDNLGNLYVTGLTYSTDFPVQYLTGAYNQTTHGGDHDTFILKFNKNGTRIWATYYGGSYVEWGLGISTDNLNNFYVTGYTESNNFPIQTLQGAYNQSTSGGSKDVFILMFNNSCARIWATYYGGNGWDYGENIYIDNLRNLYITGWILNSNFPIKILQGAFNQTTSGGEYDAFILKFSNTVDIKMISSEIHDKYSLFQNYPNPFNPTTSIRFDLHKSSLTKLIVYDILGKVIATLVNEKLNAGSYEVDWDGSRYPSGVYFYKLVVDDNSIDTKKMLLVK